MIEYKVIYNYQLIKYKIHQNAINNESLLDLIEDSENSDEYNYSYLLVKLTDNQLSEVILFNEDISQYNLNKIAGLLNKSGV